MSTAFAWGDLIRDLRVSLGVTQRALGQVAGVSRGAIQNLENHRAASADVTIIEKLLAPLGYDLDACQSGEPSRELFARARKTS